MTLDGISKPWCIMFRLEWLLMIDKYPEPMGRVGLGEARRVDAKPWVVVVVRNQVILTS